MCVQVAFIIPVYVDIGAQDGDTAMLAFTFAAANMAFQRMWDIKVTQLECTNENAWAETILTEVVTKHINSCFALRPRDTSCLQFHTGLTGRIETFNFNANNDNHLNNQQ